MGQSMKTGRTAAKEGTGCALWRERETESRETEGERSAAGKTKTGAATVAFLCDIWQSGVKGSVKPSTYACYLTLIEKHIRAELGEVPVDRLTNRILMEFVGRKQKQGLSAGTVRLILFLMKRVVQSGAGQGLEPAEELRFRMPKQLPGRKDMMEWEDFHKMLCHLLKSGRSFDLGILLSLSTGIRVGELCGIRWADIDLRAGILRVRRTVSRIRNVELEEGEEEGDRDAGQRRTIVQIGPPKTGTSLRDIPLPQFLVERLENRLAEKKFSPQSYVLTGSARCMEPRGVQRRFKNLLRKCGIEPVNIHSLRHSFASKWIENGFDSKALSEILGHSSIKITMDIYVHSSMSQKKSYMDHVLESF